MIHTLELNNYRGFERYKLSNLARVNLLVGKNNSGKTSILEAVQLLASRANSDVLFGIAERRGEIVDISESPHGARISLADYSGFFYGRDIHVGSKLSLETTSDAGRSVLEAEVVAPEPPGLGQLAYANAPSPTIDLRFKADADAPDTQSIRRSVPLSANIDTNLHDHILRVLAANRSPGADDAVQFITQESLSDKVMRGLWDEIALEGREDEIVAAMRILEPRLSSIVFLSGGGPYSARSRGGILLGYEGERRRHPLGSHGEGMRRLLALALCLATTRGRVLLIDEVDTGLHYSILGDVWLLIVNAAKEFDIQVFLTTHSYDCVRALAWLCATHPELGSEVSIQKVERAIDEAVSLDAEQIQIAVEQDIEVR